MMTTGPSTADRSSRSRQRRLRWSATARGSVCGLALEPVQQLVQASPPCRVSGSAHAQVGEQALQPPGHRFPVSPRVCHQLSWQGRGSHSVGQSAPPVASALAVPRTMFRLPKPAAHHRARHTARRSLGSATRRPLLRPAARRRGRPTRSAARAHPRPARNRARPWSPPRRRRRATSGRPISPPARRHVRRATRPPPQPRRAHPSHRAA